MIAKKLRDYIEERGITYDVLSHDPTPSASKTAQASHVSGNRIAKGVVLKDGERFMLAVLQASHQIRFDALERALHRRVTLASEEEMETLFEDCKAGAVPAIGSAYGLEVIMDESLPLDSDLYLEGGDHASLLHIPAGAMELLMPDAQHASFSR